MYCDTVTVITMILFIPDGGTRSSLVTRDTSTFGTSSSVLPTDFRRTDTIDG